MNTITPVYIIIYLQVTRVHISAIAENQYLQKLTWLIFSYLHRC